MIRKEKRDKIVAQSLDEISFSRRYKQGKVSNWQKNEQLYYGDTEKDPGTRANVDLGQMAEHVDTMLSKIDNPLIFKFFKRKEAQLKRAERLNSLRERDSNEDYWNLKDIAGKKQAILYGRAVFAYHADSNNGYAPHLENVDVYDFLIDPSAGGLDIGNAFYMGRYSVIKTRTQLQEGRKEGLYLKSEVDNLLNGSGNADESSQEETNKHYRETLQGTVGRTQDDNPDKYKFWEWYTTFEGEKYYLLMDESGCAIRVEVLKDLFESDMFPFWTYALTPDQTEFWTPSSSDKVRETILAQAKSVNQMLDNSEQINKPQRIIDVTAVEDLASLKYRKDGYIKVKSDVNRVFKTVETPSIKTPIDVFNMLEAVKEKASGLTAGAKGVADEDKVGIYEGNQANTADRFGLLNKTYSFGYQRFAELWEHGVREHLTKKVAVDILGPEGVEVEEVSSRDIFRKNEEFGLTVEASDAELSQSIVEKKARLTLLTQNNANPVQNPKKAYEMMAKTVGFNPEEIRQLMETSEFGDSEIMSEAERDIEAILDGKEVKPNRKATLSYKERFVDYIDDHEEDITDEQFDRITRYIVDVDEVVIANTIKKLEEEKQKMALSGGQPPVEGAKLSSKEITL